MFQEVYLKINGKWVQRVVIALVSTFDQKIIVFEELKENFIKKYQNYPLYAVQLLTSFIRNCTAG